MRRSIFAGILFSLTLFPLHADDDKKSDKDEKSEEKKKEEKSDGDSDKNKESVTKHTVKIGESELSYTATAGTITLKKDYGEPRADVFYIAYTKEGEEAGKRPVSFCFNGGPGSSSVWLHLGAFGPKRIVMPEGGATAPAPPFELTDNAFSILDKTDLVFIDPVSTGFSRAEKGENPKQFHGFREDVESVGDFIHRYVSGNDRWASPKFLMGESYGAIRGCGLASHLQDRYGMYLNGLVIVSGVMDFRTLMSDTGNDLSYICFLPTIAATAHYHKKLAPELMKDLAKTVAEVEEFAFGDYATALLKGAKLDTERRHYIAAKLEYYTGLPIDHILRERLRISTSDFRVRLLQKEEENIGRFDSRVIGDTRDPSYDVVYGVFATCLNDYVRRHLDYESYLPYEILTGKVRPWSYDQFTNRYVNVASDLASALKSNNDLKVFVACGYYDLATPHAAIQHTLNHMAVEPKLLENVSYAFYEGGHMMYTNLTALENLKQDLDAFIDGAK